MKHMRTIKPEPLTAPTRKPLAVIVKGTRTIKNNRTKYGNAEENPDTHFKASTCFDGADIGHYLSLYVR